MMVKQLLALFIMLSLVAGVSSAAENVLLQPDLFSSDMEQHGAFLAQDLLTSPLLRAMFNLSVNDVNSDLVRICLNQQNQCRVVRRDAKVYLVANNGKVKFDDPTN